MMGALTRQTRRYLDKMNEEAGWSTRQSGRSQRILSLALGLSEGRVSHICNGDPSGAPQRFYAFVTQLTMGMKTYRTHPGRLISDAIFHAENALAPFSDRDCRALYFRVASSEIQAQAKEDVISIEVARTLAQWDEGRGPAAIRMRLMEALREQDEALAEAMGWGLTKRLLNHDIRRRLEGEVS